MNKRTFIDPPSDGGHPYVISAYGLPLVTWRDLFRFHPLSHTIFWAEVVALTAFGVSWLTKSGAKSQWRIFAGLQFFAYLASLTIFGIGWHPMRSMVDILCGKDQWQTSADKNQSADVLCFKPGGTYRRYKLEEKTTTLVAGFFYGRWRQGPPYA